MDRRPRLRHHLVAIVIVKLALLGLLAWWLHGQRPARIDDVSMARHLAGEPGSDPRSGSVPQGGPQ